MQKLALIAFFAQSSQPVFADEVVEGVGCLMLVRTSVTQRAVSFAESLAIWTAGIKAETVFASEEVGEGEVISWSWSTSIRWSMDWIDGSGSASLNGGGHFCESRLDRHAADKVS